MHSMSNNTAQAKFSMKINKRTVSNKAAQAGFFYKINKHTYVY